MGCFRHALLCTLLAALSAPIAPAGEAVRITTDGRLKFTPVAVDDDTVVYADFVSPSLYQLQRLRLSDGAIQPLRTDSKNSEFEPDFAADGSTYAFCRTVGVLSVSMVISRADGTLLGEVPPPIGFAGLRSPAVAPDGSRVAYSLAEEGRQQIYSVLPDGSDRRAHTDSRGQNNWPHWSPDGAWLAFSSSRDDDFEIYVAPTAGGDPRRLTTTPGSDIRPRFSPDGSRIAFTSHRDGNAEIYVMQSDGSSPRRLTHNDDRDDYPAWTRDGRRLIVVSERGGKHDLYLLPVD